MRGSLPLQWKLASPATRLNFRKSEQLIQGENDDGSYLRFIHQSGRELNAIAYAPPLDIMAGYLEEKYQRSPGEAGDFQDPPHAHGTMERGCAGTLKLLLADGHQ